MSMERGRKDGIIARLEKSKEDREKLRWKGTFEEYLDKVLDNPALVRSSSQTLYSAIESNPDFFTSGPNALYGADEMINSFKRVVKASAEGYGIGRRILLMVGPPGSGKSSLANMVKKGLEDYSKTDEGAIYAIDDCPMHEDPMHLIPRDIRAEMEGEYDFHIEGDLCPQCKIKYRGDDFDADGNITRTEEDKIKSANVKRIVISEDDRIGIGTFKPADTKSQNKSELTGDVNFSGLSEYGSASDARAFDFDGELQRANRGVMELVEMLKNDGRFLYEFLDLAQDRTIKAPRYANMFADEVILAHTNFAEYNSFISNPKNEAMINRLSFIPSPYVLRVSDEVRAYEKEMSKGKHWVPGAHNSNPHALETAAQFAVLTRLSDHARYSDIQKMKIYNGQDAEGLSQRDLQEMKQADRNEGMTGISPRFVIDALSLAFSEKGSNGCVTSLDVLDALHDYLDKQPHTREMKEDDRRRIESFIDKAQTQFDITALKEVQQAFLVSNQEAARNISNNYISNVQAFCDRGNMVDEGTGEERAPDEALMRRIEERMSVSETGKMEFRNVLRAGVDVAVSNGESFDYTSHSRLKGAIEAELLNEMSGVLRMTISTDRPSREQQRRIKAVERALIQNHGYCEHCASEIVRYVGGLTATAS